VLLIGFFVGLLARALHPGNDKMGIIMTTLLGIGGSYVASYGGHALGIYPAGHVAQFVAAIIGAIVLLVAGNMIRRLLR
jgi:uncharacterized membrane protein YeaQ/YmgE (transglycosylase-associated protein family)